MNDLSILLPLYIKNEAAILEEALKSLVSQTITNFDVIICQDGPLSRDVIELLRKYENSLSIIYIKNDVPIGLAKNLNTGLEYILNNSYSFIARLDGDDICLPNRLEKQIFFLNEHPECDVLGGSILEIDLNGKEKKIIRYPIRHDECFRFFEKRSPFAHPTVMFRNTFFKKAGLYPTKPLNEYTFIKQVKNPLLKGILNILNSNFLNFGGREDTLMWFVGFYYKCNFANLSDVLLKYRIIDYNFKNRKVSYKRSNQMLYERILINRTLNYGIISYIYAIGRVLLESSPGFVRRLLYTHLR